MVDYEKIIKVIKEEVEKETFIVDEMAYKRGYANAITEENERCDIEESYAEGYLDGLESMVEAIFSILDMDYFERKEKFGTTHIMEILKSGHPINILKELVDENKECTQKDTVNEVIKTIKESGIESDIFTYLLNNSLLKSNNNTISKSETEDNI